MRAMLRIGLFVVLAVAAASAQKPRFDVASIRVSPDPDTTFSTSRPGEVRFGGMPLRRGIVAFAFNVHPLTSARFDVSRVGPKVIESTRFDIHAKGPVDGDTRAMALSLLEERFGLKWHKETRQVQVYALKVKKAGVLGPKLKPTSVNCVGWSGDTLPRECRSSGVRNGIYPFTSAGPLSVLVGRLQQYARLPVVDATGLTGNYAFDVAIPFGVDIITAQDAIEDQLGLTFERRIGPWEVIVIDDIKMPTPN